MTLPATGWATFSGLSCSGVHCFVVGYGTDQKPAIGEFDTAGGGITTIGAIPEPRGFYANLLACPSLTTCVLSGNHSRSVLVTRTAGSSWSSRMLPKGTVAEGQLACPTDDFCSSPVTSKADPGQILMATTSNLGASWNVGAFVRSPSAYLVNVGCPSRHICYADGPGVGDNKVMVRVTGRPWVVEMVPSGPPALTSVSCLLALCLSAGAGDLWQSGNGGVSWHEIRWTLPQSLIPQSLRCFNDSTCLLGGQLFLAGGQVADAGLYVSRDFGIKWTLVVRRSGDGGIPEILCFTSRSCDAFASVQPAPGAIPTQSQVLRSTDDATTWRVLSRSTPYVVAASCGSQGDCMAASASGRVMKTRDGGATWTSGGAVRQSLSAITCRYANVCLALGVVLPLTASGEAESGIYETINAGNTWNLLTSPGENAFRLLCRANECWEVSQIPGQMSTVQESVNGGFSWAPPSLSEPFLDGLDVTGSGRWILIGGDDAGGALIESHP